MSMFVPDKRADGREAEAAGQVAARVHPYLPPPRNQIQETAFAVQFVPGMRFLVFDFGVYDSAVLSPYDSAMLSPDDACDST
eukprot:1256768-Rhodomonas_salina.1